MWLLVGTEDCLGYLGHSAHVVNVRFSEDGSRLCSVGGRDRAVFQWSVDVEAKPQLHAAKARKEIDVKEVPQRKRVPKLPAGAVKDEEEEEKEEEQQRKAAKGAPKPSKPMKKPYVQQSARIGEEQAKESYTVAIKFPNKRSSVGNGTLSLTFEFADGSSWSVDASPQEHGLRKGQTAQWKTKLKAGNVDIQNVHVATTMEETWLIDKIMATRDSTGRRLDFLLYGPIDQGGKSIARTVAKKGSRDTGEQQLELIVHTAEKSGSGTEAWIYCKLEGEEASTETMALDRDRPRFQEGSRDAFSRVVAQLGKLKSATMTHNESGKPWGLEKLEVISPDSGETYSFKGDVRINQGESAQLYPSEAVTASAYKVMIQTADAKGAGLVTEGLPSIKMMGKNKSGEQVETAEKSLDTGYRDQFARGKEDTIFLTSSLLDELDQAVLKLEDEGGSEWKVEWVWIQNVDTGWSKNMKPTNFWLNNETEFMQTLYPEEKEPSGARSGQNEYEIRVRTADERLAGTQAKVRMCLSGELEGQERATRTILLENSAENFTRGNEDVFTVYAKDVGNISSIDLWHDGTGENPEWKVEYIQVANLTTGSRAFFYIDTLLNSQNDNAISAEPRSPPAETEKLTYAIHVYTSDERGAGTSADVYVDIKGSEGSTGRRELSASNDSFQRGSTDTFRIETAFLGDLEAVHIGHSDKGAFSGWHLDKVIVECESANSEGQSKRAVFPHRGWLSSKDPPYKTEVRLFPDLDDDGTAERPAGYQEYEYVVKVYTSDVRGAVTTSTVSIELVGSEGAIGPYPLDEGEFDRNSVDRISLRAPDIGELSQCIVSIDGKGWRPDWHCAQLEIFSSATGENYVFPCNKWFSEKEQKGGKLKRNLLQGIGEKGVDEGKRNYKISVYTTDRSGAGTDASVTLTVKGNKAAIQDEPLENTGNTFGRGQEDTFFITSDDIADVSEEGEWLLEEVAIETDGGFWSPKWHLSHFTILDPALNIEATFRCHGWIDKKNRRRMWRREGGVPGEQALEKEGGVEDEVWYRIRVLTGDKMWASTDETITFTFVNSDGEWWTPPLPQDRSTFEKGDLRAFSKLLPTCRVANESLLLLAGKESEMMVSRVEDFGDFAELRVAPLEDKWLMEEVSIQNYGDGREWKFLKCVFAQPCLPF